MTRPATAPRPWASWWAGRRRHRHRHGAGRPLDRGQAVQRCRPGTLQRHPSRVPVAARPRRRSGHGGCARCGECVVGTGGHGGAVHHRIQHRYRRAQDRRHRRRIRRRQRRAGAADQPEPGQQSAGFSAGAVDATLAIASFSSRGPSACDGTVYPKLVAPGVNINTADLSFGGLPLYAVVSGTSFAAPHAAGAMALLAGAFPGASVGQLEAALTGSARDLGVAGEDNSYGYWPGRCAGGLPVPAGRRQQPAAASPRRRRPAPPRAASTATP